MGKDDDYRGPTSYYVYISPEKGTIWNIEQHPTNKMLSKIYTVTE
jgi:hypothetical protein